MSQPGADPTSPYDRLTGASRPQYPGAGAEYPTPYPAAGRSTRPSTRPADPARTAPVAYPPDAGTPAYPAGYGTPVAPPSGYPGGYGMAGLDPNAPYGNDRTTGRHADMQQGGAGRLQLVPGFFAPSAAWPGLYAGNTGLVRVRQLVASRDRLGRFGLRLHPLRTVAATGSPPGWSWGRS